MRGAFAHTFPLLAALAGVMAAGLPTGAAAAEVSAAAADSASAVEAPAAAADSATAPIPARRPRPVAAAPT